MPFSIVPGGGGGVTFADVIVNFDGTAGNYWDETDIQGPHYQIQEVTAPGVDGVAVERDGFRSRYGWANVYIVAASRAACLAVLATLDSCFNSACAITDIDGSVFQGCEMMSYKKLEGPNDTGLSTFMMKVFLEFEQKRLT